MTKSNLKEIRKWVNQGYQLGNTDGKALVKALDEVLEIAVEWSNEDFKTQREYGDTIQHIVSQNLDIVIKGK